MKYPITNAVNACFLALASTFALPAYADWSVTVGDPDKAGTLNWVLIHVKKEVINGQTFETLVEVPVKIVLDGTEDSAKKAEKVIKAINDADTSVGKIYGAKPSVLDKARIRISDSVVGIKREPDSTGEKDRFEVSRLDSSLIPRNATVDFHVITGTVLAGIDQDGLESQFHSSFGFDGIVANADFNFSDLSGNTIDTLLTDTYNSFLADLPLIYQSMLSLNLSNDEISFAFPTGVSSAFVENFTSDVNASSSLGLAMSVPEPSTLLLVSIAIFGMSFRHRRA